MYIPKDYKTLQIEFETNSKIIGKLFSLSFSEEEHEKIKSAISALLWKLGKVTSFFHFEGILTKNSGVFPIEFNIRMAGAEAPCIFNFMTGTNSLQCL